MSVQPTRRNEDSRIGRSRSIEYDLSFKSPYDWRSIIRFYQSHAVSGIERVTDDSFERVFRIENTIGFLRVRAITGKQRLNVRMVPDDPAIVVEAVRRLRKMFDLDCNPRLIAKRLGSIPLFATLCKRFPGLRVARGWDPFETAICTILGQLVAARQRANLVGQLVSNYGEEITDPASGERTRLFPLPEVLARSDLSAVGTTRARREAIRAFSRRVLSGAISFADGLDPAAFRKALLETKGLGPWSAEYISLRAAGDTDAFPKTDLILKRVLDLHPDLDLPRLTPWRSYAAIYLWKNFAQTLSKSQRRQRQRRAPGSGEERVSIAKALRAPSLSDDDSSMDRRSKTEDATNVKLSYKEIDSPVGTLKLVASPYTLVAVLWERERPNRVKLDTMNFDARHPVLIEAERQLTEYFSGTRTEFDVPIEPQGSEFQKKVWQALRQIPFGETKSYLELAQAIGSPTSVRAVGAANGKNPLSIIVPCHRVVGANGSLTGFAGGLEAKAKLLALEAKASSTI